MNKPHSESCFQFMRGPDVRGNLAHATMPQRTRAAARLLNERIKRRNHRGSYRQQIYFDYNSITVSEDGAVICSAKLSEALDRQIAQYQYDCCRQQMLIELKQFEDGTDSNWKVLWRETERGLRTLAQWMAWASLDRPARERRPEPRYRQDVTPDDVEIDKGTLNALRRAAEMHCT